MKYIKGLFIALLLLFSLTAEAQLGSNIPPVGAYSFDTGAWAPISGTGSVGALPSSPPPMALYCQNSSGQWIAWTAAQCGGGGGGSGTVTSVALTVPSWLTVAGSPISTSGTLAVTPTTAQTSHQVIGTCGTATTFAPCSLVAGDLPSNQILRSIGATFNGGGSALTGTTTICVPVNYAGTIQGVTLISDVSGSATVDVRTVAYASYTGPSSATTITASDTPALSSAVKYQDTTLTGWTTSLSANTIACFVLSSPSTITWASINVKVAAS